MQNVIFVGWRRSIPGRERIGERHFNEYAEYLGALQKKGEIQSFDVVFLTPHGGSLEGFFLIKGEPSKLDAVCSSEEFVRHNLLAGHHLDGHLAVRGVSGEALMKQFGVWSQLIPT